MIPQNFSEIFFFIIAGTPAFLLIYLTLFFETKATSVGFYMERYDNEIVPITFIPKKSEKFSIKRSTELLFIPEMSQSEFIFDENEEPFVLHYENLFYFYATLKITPKRNHIPLRDYFNRMKKGKKSKISQSEMRKLVERALDKSFHLGDLGYFPKLLKNEIAHFTCFHHEDISINEDFLLTSKKR